MSFLWPGNLWALAVVPLVVALYLVAQRRRRRYALRYASLALVKEALGRGPGLRRHIPPALYVLAVLLMTVGLARPVTVITVPSQEGTVILAIDVSGSMRATDLKPDRLEAAKEAARTFVLRQDEHVRIGVVAFSTDASIVQAPTNDKDLVIAAINRLHTQRATAIGRAILTSLDAIFEGDEGDPPSAVLTKPLPAGGLAPRPQRTAAPGSPKAAASIILLTDGQNNQFPPPLAIIDVAVARGVRVYTVGVGSTEGTVVSFEGRMFRTSLDEATLKAIAQATDAEYFLAASETDLKRVYESLTTQLVLRTQKSEVTALFTIAAAALSIVAGGLSLLWFNRLP